MNIRRFSFPLVLFFMVTSAAADSRPAPLPHRWNVPVVAHVKGAQGSLFRSDLRVLNDRDEPVSVQLIFTPTGADGRSDFVTRTVRIPRNSTYAIDDVVLSLFGRETAGTLAISSDAALLTSSRLYNETAAGTLGQYVPATSDQESAGLSEPPLHVTGLRNDAQFRSNIGVAEVRGDRGEVAVELFRADGTSTTRAVSIEAYSHQQFALDESAEGVVRAVVRVTSGDAGITAYGSVIDNESGDPSFFPAARLPRNNECAHVAGAIDAAGAFGSYWRTSGMLVNAGPEENNVALLLYTAEGIRFAGFTMGPYTTKVFDDVVGSLFAYRGGRGHLATDGNALGDILFVSRTASSGENGSAGDSIMARSFAEGLTRGGDSRRALHVEQSARFRSNVFFAEVGDAPVTLRVSLFDGRGALVTSKDVALRPYEQRQLSMSELGVSALANGNVKVELIEGNGRIFGYLSLVDNATNDSTIIPMQ